MPKVISKMIQEAKREGGVPAGGKRSFEDSFTYEPSLNLLILWYNVGKTTKIAVRSVSRRPRDIRFSLHSKPSFQDA